MGQTYNTREEIINVYISTLKSERMRQIGETYIYVAV
jgi:hypothetical protein